MNGECRGRSILRCGWLIICPFPRASLIAKFMRAAGGKITVVHKETGREKKPEVRHTTFNDFIIFPHPYPWPVAFPTTASKLWPDRQLQRAYLSPPLVQGIPWETVRGFHHHAVTWEGHKLQCFGSNVCPWPQPRQAPRGSWREKTGTGYSSESRARQGDILREALVAERVDSWLQETSMLLMARLEPSKYVRNPSILWKDNCNWLGFYTPSWGTAPVGRAMGPHLRLLFPLAESFWRGFWEGG